MLLKILQDLPSKLFILLLGGCGFLLSHLYAQISPLFLSEVVPKLQNEILMTILSLTILLLFGSFILLLFLIKERNKDITRKCTFDPPSGFWIHNKTGYYYCPKCLPDFKTPLGFTSGKSWVCMNCRTGYVKK